MKITNNHGVDLPLAVWLLQDGYNSGAAKAPPGELISVTKLMKPTRQLILERKVPYADRTMDIADRAASRMGHAIHDSVERAWTEGNWEKALAQLHYPQSIIDKVKINPHPKTLQEGDIPIYLEQRGFKEMGGIVLTGQQDFSIGGAYRDFKSTSTFSYTSGSKDQDYILQGSMYRLVLPHIITNDIMRIEFIFTDWLRYRAKQDPNYPQTKIAHKDYALMSVKDTEGWIMDKLAEIRRNAKKDQDTLIRCTDKELWRQEDEFKYYSNPETAAKGGRATKNFGTDQVAAEKHRAEKGKGVVKKKAGEVKACSYCPAFAICKQREEYFQDDGLYIG